MRKGYFLSILALLFGTWALHAQTPMIPPVPTIPPAGAIIPSVPTFADGPPVIDAPAFNTRIAHRVWGDAEVLFWWTKNESLATPIVTSTTTLNISDASGSSISGGVGVPGTTVLVGDNALSYGMRVGTRLTFGVWLDSDDTIGIEGKGLYLTPGSIRLSYQSSPGGFPLIGIPVRDAFNIFSPLGGENQVAESTPTGMHFPNGTIDPGFKGGDTVLAHTTLWGAEANGVFNLLRNDCYKVDLIAGFKYMGLNDDLSLIGQSTNLTPLAQGGGTSGVFFLNKAYDGTVTAVDQWSTTNKFYGGQIGARGEFICGRFVVDVRGQIAAGETMQTMTINGYTNLQTTGGMFGSTPGGTLALQNNIGTYKRNSFSLVPEIGLKLNYFFTSRISGFVGYDFMYWSNVALVGDQVNRTVDLRQVPTLGSYNPAVVNTLNPPTINTSGFWAQGVNLGIQFKF